MSSTLFSYLIFFPNKETIFVPGTLSIRGGLRGVIYNARGGGERLGFKRYSFQELEIFPFYNGEDRISFPSESALARAVQRLSARARAECDDYVDW